MDVDPIVRGLVRGLLHAPQDRGLRSRVLAHRAAAVQPLIELLADRDLWSTEAPGGGMGPVAAAELLGELRAADAVGPLVDTLRDLGPLNVLYSAVVRALRDVGSAATEPLVALALETQREPDAFDDPEGLRIGCLEVLCEVARGDERVYTLLCEIARKEPQWAGFLATFGDPRALPLLHDLAASYVPRNVDHPFADQVWVELCAAIQDLGEPTAAERQKDAEIQAARRRRRD